MLDYWLKANLIELLELKHTKEVNQEDNLNYYKYHCLINHLVEKYFVMKDRFMRLHENGKIIFYDEVTTFNIMNMMNLGSHQSLPEISFGSFKPMELDILFPISFSTSLSQVSYITLILQVSNLKLDSFENCDNE
jgi:hypothetical protein